MLRLGVSLTLIAAIVVGQALAMPCIHLGTGDEVWFDHVSQPHFHWNLGTADDGCHHHHAGHDDDHRHTTDDPTLCGCQLHDHDGTACYLSQTELIVSATSRQLLDWLLQGVQSVAAICNHSGDDQPYMQLGLSDTNSLGSVALRASGGDFLATQRLQL